MEYLVYNEIKIVELMISYELLVHEKENENFHHFLEYYDILKHNIITLQEIANIISDNQRMNLDLFQAQKKKVHKLYSRFEMLKREYKKKKKMRSHAAKVPDGSLSCILREFRTNL